ncbi:MAG: amino acid adenylation domain-containing protein, partial [Clostridiales bacterium]|nr:amino acid adenylation domain-containing protein [Clostridiales bacterium]
CEEFSVATIYSREQTNYGLAFSAFTVDEGLIVKLSYDPKKYSADNIQILRNHLESIVEQMISDPNILVSEITACDVEEKETILKDFNDTITPYLSEKTIVDLFEEQVQKTPDNIAVVYEDESLTYAELNAKANQIAFRLRELGVKPNDLVAMLTERSIEMIAGIFGILKSGGAYLPMDPTYPEDRISYMLEDAAPKAVLTYKAGVKTDLPVIDLADSEVYTGASENLERVNTPDDLIYVIYTSGTTGKPKGVLIEHSGVNNLANFYINEHNVGSDDKFLMFASYCFDASTTEIMTTLLSGAELHVASSDLRGDTLRLEKYISEKGITIALLPPALLEQLNVKGPRVIITAGSESSRRIIENNQHIPVYSNDYGPTEGSVCATVWKYESGDVLPERIPIGKPISNKQVYIMQGETLCGIGVPGELCIAGVGIARGYLNRPELTAEKFVADPYGDGRMYHTGDLARWLPDGNIEYLGRIDDQVKIRGFRVELGEIENRIKEIDNIKDCAVIAKEDASGEKAIYAYIVSDIEISSSDIRDALSKNLPDYMIPSYMMRIDSIPVTRNGKLDKRALPDIEAGTGNEYVAPRNETEEKICAIFSEILSVEKVSVKDSFFVLGGHSLRATRLVNRIEAETGTRIALKEVFSNPTPERLAVCVTGSTIDEYISIPNAAKKEYYPMSSAQKRTFLICQMDPDGILYNMPQNYKLTGEVCPEALKTALQQVINRHEILRTQFLMVDGEPVQKILEYVNADFEY